MPAIRKVWQLIQQGDYALSCYIFIYMDSGDNI